MNIITILTWLRILMFVGVLVLGAVVSVQAFRGYRRSGDVTMRYFAIGLGLVLVAAPLVSIIEELAQDAIISAGMLIAHGIFTLQQSIEFLGVCALVYALYVKRQL